MLTDLIMFISKEFKNYEHPCFKCPNCEKFGIHLVKKLFLSPINPFGFKCIFCKTKIRVSWISIIPISTLFLIMCIIKNKTNTYIEIFVFLFGIVFVFYINLFIIKLRKYK